MSSIQKILCPTDFSPFSRTALAHALSLAEKYKAVVYVQHVTETLPATYYSGEVLILRRDDLENEIREKAYQAMEEFIPREAKERLTVRPVIVEGNAYKEIVSLVENERIDLVVMGTHGRTGLEKFFLGSVTEKVIRKAACPVLTVREAGSEWPKEIRFSHILVSIDFSAHSAKTLDYARALAEDYNAQLHVLHVVEEGPYIAPLELRPFNMADITHELIKDAEEKLAELVPESARSRAESLVQVGHAHQEIHRAAQELHADLIVMGVSGRGALDTALFGSTTYRIMRSATCPVLAVR